jgi:Fe-S-cluster-containing hydrogenase component 2
MGKKILINLPGYLSGGDNNQSPPEAVTIPGNDQPGLRTIREQAVFRFTCRKCTDAPCIAACPAEALEKDPEGIISRAINLCIACKSCVVICPFGTLMTDFFTFKKDKEAIFNLSDKEAREKFIRLSGGDAVQVIEVNDLQDDLVHQLNEEVVIREYVWDKT